MQPASPAQRGPRPAVPIDCQARVRTSHRAPCRDLRV